MTRAVDARNRARLTPNVRLLEMLPRYEEVLADLEVALSEITQLIGRAEKAPKAEGFVYRFTTRRLSEAVSMKLALLLSTLHAAVSLHRNGHYLQQAMLQRVIGELDEDILFLCYGLMTRELTDLHKRYLDAFWAEEFEDVSDPVGSHSSRPTIPRKKIRAYLSRIQPESSDPSTTSKIYKVLSKGYSGFVHGAAPHIMEMYGGDPPAFHTRSLSDTPREPEYRRDLGNYVYRGLLSFVIAAHGFDRMELRDRLMQRKAAFEAEVDVFPAT